MTQTNEDDKPIADLIGRLSSWRRSVREAAAANVARLMGVQSSLAAEHARRALVCPVRSAGTASCFALVLAYVPLLLHRGHMVPSGLAATCLIVGLGALMVSFACTALLVLKWRRVLGALVNAPPVWAGPVLLDMWPCVNQYLRPGRAIEECLARWVPSADREALDGLSLKQLATLRTIVQFSSDEVLQTAALSVFCTVGGRPEADVARTIAGPRPWGSRHPSVRREALRTIRIIEERLDREGVTGELVRPASAPTDDYATLMRPVAGMSQTDGDQLVRPVSCGGAGDRGPVELPVVGWRDEAPGEEGDGDEGVACRTDRTDRGGGRGGAA